MSFCLTWAKRNVLPKGKVTEMSKNYCFVIDGEGKPLDPMLVNKAWYKIRKKHAKLVNKFPMTIQLDKIIPVEEINKDEVRLGVDDGAEHVGLALVQKCQTKNKVLLKATIEHRKDVKKLLEVRKSYRRHRRYWKRHRQARFDNRSSATRKGRVAPSILQRKQAVIRVLTQIVKFARLDTLYLEDTAFDIRALTDGYKPYKWQYQKSNRLDENIRKATILRDNCKCQICGKGNCRLEVHHITPRRFGGSNTLGNLVTLCESCHAKVTGKESEYYDTLYQKIKGKNNVTIKYAQHVMQGKTWLRNELGYFGVVNLTNGGETANRRLDWGIEKSHSNDAICCTGLKPKRLNLKEWIVKPMRRKSKAHTDNVLGFRHRDIIGYTDTKGIYYQGYITGLYPDKLQLNFQSPEKHLKRVNAKKCEMVWSFNKAYWL